MASQITTGGILFLPILSIVSHTFSVPRRCRYFENNQRIFRTTSWFLLADRVPSLWSWSETCEKRLIWCDWLNTWKTSKCFDSVDSSSLSFSGLTTTYRSASGSFGSLTTCRRARALNTLSGNNFFALITHSKREDITGESTYSTLRKAIAWMALR